MNRLLEISAYILCVIALIAAVISRNYFIASAISFAVLAFVLSRLESELQAVSRELKNAKVGLNDIDPKEVLALRKANPQLSIAEAIKKITDEKDERQ